MALVPTELPQNFLGHGQFEEFVVIDEPVDFTSNKKLLIVLAGIGTSFNANLASSLPSGAAKAIAERFSVESSLQLVLPNSLHLLGLAVGPLIFGPLSEHVGRRPVLVGAHLWYTIFAICCAVSPSFDALLAFKLLGGIGAGAPIAVIGPLYADIYNDPVQRGTAIAWFACTAIAAPNFGPVISGYAGSVSWNLPIWLGVAISGILFLPLLFIPETYVPVLKKRVVRKANSRSVTAEGVWKPHHASGTRELLCELKLVFSRPFLMLGNEPIVLFTTIYCSFVYTILFLFFQAYPVIFGKLYGLSTRQTGLAFLPIVVGSVLALAVFIAYDSYYNRNLQENHTWEYKDEYRRLPLACFGGPAIVASLFWLGWASNLSIHPVVPALSGFLFGTGYVLVFIAMINYLGDAYRQYAAPAQAAASTVRSLVGVCLPLAAPRMYDVLGVSWACSLLAFITLALALIPFAFIRYGKILRERSAFYQRLRRQVEVTN